MEGSVMKSMLKKTKGTKRLEGLAKKTKELSILCDIDALLICIEGEGNDTSSSTCYTWPEDKKISLSLIEKYKNSGSSVLPGKRKRIVENHSGLSKKVKESEGLETGLFKKVQESEELNMCLSKKPEKGKEHGIEGLGLDQLKELLTQVDHVILDVNERIRFLTMNNQNNIKDPMASLDKEGSGQKGPVLNCDIYSNMSDSIAFHGSALDYNLKNSEHGGSNDSMIGHDDVDTGEGFSLEYWKKLLFSDNGLSLDVDEQVQFCTMNNQGEVTDIDIEEEVEIFPALKENENQVEMEGINQQWPVLSSDSCSDMCHSIVIEGTDLKSNDSFGHGGFIGSDDWMMDCDHVDICDGLGLDLLELLSPIDQLDVNEGILLSTMNHHNKVIDNEIAALENQIEMEGSSQEEPVLDCDIYSGLCDIEDIGEGLLPSVDHVMLDFNEEIRFWTRNNQYDFIDTDDKFDFFPNLKEQENLVEMEGPVFGCDSYSGLLDSTVLQGCGLDDLTSLYGDGGFTGSNDWMMGCDYGLIS